MFASKSIFKLSNEFASLQYRKKNIIIEAFDRFALICMPLKGNGISDF